MRKSNTRARARWGREGGDEEDDTAEVGAMRGPRRGWRKRGDVERGWEWNPGSESAEIQKRRVAHAPSSAVQQTALYILVLKGEELVLEAEQWTGLEAGSRERTERLRWSAAMRWMIQRRRECREVDQAYRRRGEEVRMKVRRPRAKGRCGGKGK